MTQVSDHFTLEDFACKDGTPYPVDRPDEEQPGKDWGETRLGPLLETLEVIREALGKPLRVDSAYRTLEYDQRLWDRSVASGGGHRDKAPPALSQHPRGRAADVSTGSLTAAQLRDLVVGLYMNGKLPHLGGVGVYPSFVHVDVRPRPGSKGAACDGHLAQWGGRRLSNVP